MGTEESCPGGGDERRQQWGAEGADDAGPSDQGSRARGRAATGMGWEGTRAEGRDAHFHRAGLFSGLSVQQARGLSTLLAPLFLLPRANYFSVLPPQMLCFDFSVCTARITCNRSFILGFP